ncbi:hypothetical protein GLYMA_09G194600v4 [Glycine max]|uniref:Uncharacterized protein n=1 Tax=Glycine max TaxID=3847 RepID=A0A0R0II09_SOYBN|nr:hypothetical protein GLYMA_09G194600v4 [Glycine max]KAH1043787.1 hypothetical protein GYH30_025567 [Glycine max]KAH1043794.1 hypothetical protein GYH30_025567 [Glycine max]KRH39355.1 hypothetical protein GLYMA_09G194600v4 [Glycine max]
MFNVTFASHSKEYASEKEADLESDGGTSSREGSIPNKGFKVASHHEDAIYSYTQKRPKYADLSTSDMLLAVKKPSNESIIQSVEMKSQNENAQVLKSPLSKSNSKPKMGTSSTSSKLVWPTSITQMNSLMLQSFNSSASMRPRWSSRRDRELLSAKLEIENAHVMSNSSGLYASIFWDVSKFSRIALDYKLLVFVKDVGCRKFLIADWETIGMIVWLCAEINSFLTLLVTSNKLGQDKTFPSINLSQEISL